MTNVSKINKALIKEGISGEITKGKGYYYFIGDLFDKVSSIYSNTLHAWTTEQVIDHVKQQTKNN